LASAFNISHEYAVVIDEPEEDGEPIDTELDIVSPFDSMFSSFDPVKKEKKPRSRKKEISFELEGEEPVKKEKKPRKPRAKKS
jgi:hypothetical protein